MDMLTKESLQYAQKISEKKGNPFMNIPAQALEILEGINRCIIILSNLQVAEEKPVEFTVEPCECEGISACAAPRGILFHRYKFDSDGCCTFADITTPTTQNLQYLEESIKEFLNTMLDKSPDIIKSEIEKLIRAYDPCISCSAHFLDLEWEAD